MSEKFKKFVTNLSMLDHYYVLRQEQDQLIVGAKIIIKEQKEFLKSVFQPRTETVTKSLPVFFLVDTAKKSSNKDKNTLKEIFQVKSLPILTIDLKEELSLEMIKEKFQLFLDQTFFS